ncbi:MAG: cellulosome protein [Prevotellaceae bacterium]|nr:cellulosome protein [Prevotellaceae bacterium]
MKILPVIIIAALMPCSLRAQRLQQPLGRSVVAVSDASGVTVTWRRLAQEPENCTYNLYRRGKGGGSYTKVNSSPVTSTCYRASKSDITAGMELAVTMVVDGKESDMSAPYLLKEQAYANAFFDFNFETTVLSPNDYRCKYVWPMDLDGNGEVDALLVDRLNATSVDNTHKLQAYTLDGTCLWTMDMGPNIEICGGQNDNVTVYDINCDGKCEVIVKTSDGTRFWNQTAGTWGQYANGSAVADTDGDGIVDYRPSRTKNPPYYVSVVDARTGAELDCAELKYSEITDGVDSYSRDNRADYMNDSDGKEYAFLTGKFVIAYFDGIHPSLGVELYNRRTDKVHHYYMASWTYDWTGGKASNWHHSATWSRNGNTPWPAEFHQMRVADTDGDGIDEMLEGGFGWNPVKGMVYSAGIGHGDRFDVSDIDPDRPGMEVFAIQQSELMGQVLYDAATGEHIKEWYLSSVYDVGRGRCMDVDAAHKGYEIFSLLPNLYDCKGNVISEGATTYPNEAIWWDGDLQRELIGSPGGNGYGTNVMVQKYNGNRLIEFSKASGWAVHSGWANRPAFMGDITGDWREEIILTKQNADSSTGLVGYTTGMTTGYSMYTLQEDSHYRLDMTGRGYYQAPCTSFYLGGGMPYPPLPPTMVTDLRWKEGTVWSAASPGFTDFGMTSSAEYADGKSVIFDKSGSNASTITVSGTLKPKGVYLMNPKGHDYTFGGGGVLAGDMTLWKSMLGTATINCNLEYSGQTVVSEGTLVLNGTVAGPIYLRAKGTLGGSATLNGNVTFEGALNYEGCRLMPTGTDGVMTFAKSLVIPGNVYIEVAAANGKCGHIMVKGDLTFNGENTFTVNHDGISEGTYLLAECTGEMTVNTDKINVRGLTGVNYDIRQDGRQLLLIVNATRRPQTGVVWTGNENGLWDYKSANFKVNGQPTAFVPGDEVVFNDATDVRSLTINDKMVAGMVDFNVNSGTYTLTGDGGISGTGNVVKSGDGEVRMTLPNNDYTGRTLINGGTLTVNVLADGGVPSSLGAADATEGNLQINGGTLRMLKGNMATDRIITLTDTATINVEGTGGSLSLKGKVTGKGHLVKTGSGQLNFTYGGTNNFAGLIVKAGIVAQGTWNSTFGFAGSPMRLEGGEVQLIHNNNSSTRPIFNYVTTVPAGAKATIRNTYRGAVNGSFKGEGTLTLVSDGVRGDIGADFSAFDGTLIVQGTNVRLMDNVTDMSRTHVQMAAGAVIGHFASNSGSTKAVTTRMGSLASTATDCVLGVGVDTYNIGYNNETTTFAGKFNARAVNKYGTGQLTLKTAGSSTPINIYGGTVSLTNIATGSSPTPYTTGKVTVYNGGTLNGTGAAATVDVYKGGTLAAGTGLSCRTFKLTGNVTMRQGSTIKIKIKGTSSVLNDKLSCSGDMVHNGDTILIDVAEGTPIEEGKEFTIFPGTGTQQGAYILKTVSPDYDIEWDDSELLLSGKLKVKSLATAITSPKAVLPAADAEVDVYSVDGQLIRSAVPFAKALDGLPKGVYIVNGLTMKK